MTTSHVQLSIVAPMFNEEANVERTLEAVIKEADALGIRYEVLLVDDGSVDGTRLLCEEARARYPQLRVLGYPQNRGRGRALREGFRQSRGRYTITIDFDLSYDASHIGRIYRALGESPRPDVVLVSCYMPGGRTVGVPFWRLLVSRWGNRVLSHAFSPRIHTSTCLVRGYRTAALRRVDLDADGKEIHLEILSKLLALGASVREIPGELSSRKAGRSKFHLRLTSFSHVLFLLLERPALHFGLVGVASLLLSLLAGTTLLLNRLFDLRVHSEIFDFVSPSVVLLFFLTSLFSFFFFITGLLLSNLRREILKIQARHPAASRTRRSRSAVNPGARSGPPVPR